MKRPLPLLIALATQLACASSPDDEESEPPLAATAAPTPAIWRPKQGASWDWQLTTPVNTGANAEIYDVDAFTVTAQVVTRLHAAGRKVVCYVNVGAWEQWRPDAAKFPAAVLGKVWSNTRFTDERWLDVRRLDVLRPLLGARFDMAKSKGCDAIEPDNLDGYDDGTARSDRTGFALTYADQIAFNRFVAAEVHRRGMSVALKNDPHQAADLVADFDFVVSEQCFDYDECKYYAPFIAAKKAILLAEYREDLGTAYQTRFDGMCTSARALGISAILKNNNLDSWRRACTDPGVGRPPGAVGSPGIGIRPGAARDAGTGVGR